METEVVFKVGDVVKVKGQSRKLTILETQGTEAVVVWETGSGFDTRSFSYEVLEHVPTSSYTYGTYTINVPTGYCVSMNNE